MIKVNSKFWTPSNAISLFRIVLIIPLIYFLQSGDTLATLLIGVLAYLSDIADGYIARKTNNVSEWGKIIDPFADKVFVATAVIMLTAKGYLPLWFTATVLSRDLLILLVGVYATNKLKYTLPSNYTGKAAVVSIGVAMILALLKLDIAFDIFACISIIMMAVSLFSYSKRLIQEIKE